jgi:hypothetical protein
VGFKIAALLAALLPALFSRAFGQNQEASMAGFQFLDFLASPRQVAMGHAGTALGGSGFASYNPASPAITDRPYLNLGYAPLPSENTIAFCEGAWMFLNMFAAAAITNEFIGGIIPADFRDGPDYDIPGSYDGTMLSLCFGYRGEALGLALCLNGLQERIVSYAGYGISVSAGLTYRVIPQKLTLGAAVFQLGSTTGDLDETRYFGGGAPLPRSGRAGAAYSDTLLKVAYTVAADIVYRDVGNKLTSASQFFDRVSVPVGIEAWPTKYIAVRIGKRFNYETDVFSFGAGLRFAMLSFDMSCDVTSLVTDIEFNPYFALTYTLPPPKPKAASVKKSPPKPPAAVPPSGENPAAGNPAEATPLQAQPPAPAHIDSAAAALQKGTEGAAFEKPQGDSLGVSPASKADSTAVTKPAEEKPQPVPADPGAARIPPTPPQR